MISCPDAAYPLSYASRARRIQARGGRPIKRHGHAHAKSIEKSMHRARERRGRDHVAQRGNKQGAARTNWTRIGRVSPNAIPPNENGEVQR